MFDQIFNTKKCITFLLAVHLKINKNLTFIKNTSGIRMAQLKKLLTTGILLTTGLHQIAWADPLSYYANRSSSEHTKMNAQHLQISAHVFEQKLNHNQTNSPTFSQRYYVDNQYATDENSPVFLYICGEATCQASSLNGAIRQYAQHFHARLVALEHRFYGKSIPTSDLATVHLKTLSTDNAIADLANFQKYLMRDFKWQGKWIAFGGSYPGNLSAYYRLKHPELVVGAIASSAPVKAKSNFYEYDQHVASVIDANCLTNIQTAVSTAEALQQSPKQFELVKKNFAAEKIKDSNDFFYLMADIAAAATQYGMHQNFCSQLSQADSPLTGYANFARELYQQWGIDPVQLTAQGAESIDADDYLAGFGMRQWLYQSCTEYGFWQNASPEPHKRARSTHINANYHQQICTRLFNIKSPVDVTKTNHDYYQPLLDPSTTKIFFTNGANDPWSKLSLTYYNKNDSNPFLNYLTIADQAHCDDLRTPKIADKQPLKDARTQTQHLIEKWLS